jgi:hypothetical protein
VLSQTDDRKAVRIAADLYEKLQDAQYQERKRTGKKRTISELIEDAWESRTEAKPSVATSGYPYDAANRALHDRLERVLTSGSERERALIEHSIAWALDDESRPAKRTKAG